MTDLSNLFGRGHGLVWEVIAANESAISGKGYMINASGGNITLTLPGSPSVSDKVGACDVYNKATTNTITIARNGNNIEGAADDLVINIDGSGIELVYADATRGWEIVSAIGVSDTVYGASWSGVTTIGASKNAVYDKLEKIVPQGVINPWVGGYFQDGSNGTFTNVLANTVGDVNTLLNPDGWYVCDGSSLNDGDSLIFDGASRYLPNLTDDRFLMGDTVAGGIGGSSTMAHTHGVTSNVAVGNHTSLSLNNHTSLTLNNHTSLALSNHSNHTTLALSNHSNHSFTQPSYPSHKHWATRHQNGSPTPDYYVYNSGGSAVQLLRKANLYGSGSATWATTMYPSSDTNYYTKTDGGGACSGGSVNAHSAHSFSQNITAHSAHSFSQNITTHSFSQNIDAHSFSQNIDAHNVTNNGVTSDGASETENRPKYLSCFYIMKVK